MANNLQKGSGGPMRLYVGALHCNITKEMLRGIFEPFGKVGEGGARPDLGWGGLGRGFIPRVQDQPGSSPFTGWAFLTLGVCAALSLGVTQVVFSLPRLTALC